MLFCSEFNIEIEDRIYVLHSEKKIVKELSCAWRYWKQDADIQPESNNFSKQLIQSAILRREISSPSQI